MTGTDVAEDRHTQRIPPYEALKVAQTDAEKAYRNLDAYRIVITLERGQWHIDYELKDTTARGGGPHYVVDAMSGKMLSKRYEQ